MFITLTQAKEHCSITTEISDAMLQLYIDASEGRVATYLNRPLDTLMDAGADEPDPVGYGNAVRLGILLYIMDAVEQRGTIVTGTISSELPTAEKILHPHRLNLGV